MVTIRAEPGKPLCIGRKGENNARQVVFYFSHWHTIYGPGTVQLIVLRTGETTPYPVALTVEGNTATWVITAADTAIHGEWGKAELRYIVNDTLAKSEIWRTVVFDALDEPSETPPKPQQGWVDQVLAAGAQAQSFAAQAKSDADRAAQIAADMAVIAKQVSLDAATASKAKEDAQTAQTAAKTAQEAAETAKQAAEDAAKTTEGNATAAATAAQRAESAANAASAALAELQTLYQTMQTYAAQAVQAIQTEGKSQLEQIDKESTQAQLGIANEKTDALIAIGDATDKSIQAVQSEGETQTANAKAQADRAEDKADEAKNAQAAAEAALAEAEALVYLTDVRDNKTFGMAWGINADGYPTLTLIEKEDTTE